jgi:hypothetical protein
MKQAPTFSPENWPRAVEAIIFSGRLPTNAMLRPLFINVPPMCNPRHSDEFRRVIDDVEQAPVTGADALLILVAFQLFASSRSGIFGQRQKFPVYLDEQLVIELIEFLLRRLLDFERVLNHAVGCVSGAMPDIVRKECSFPSDAIQTSDHPRNPPR